MPSMGAIVSQLSLLEGGCECKGSQGQRRVKQAAFVLPIAAPIILFLTISVQWGMPD